MIRIQNIYYMLAYAYQVLNEKGYENIAVEEFDNTADLLSAILVKGISVQIKRGLNREYIETTEPLSCLKGKIDVTNSIKEQTLIKQQLICTYDDYSIDTYLNRILKSTMLVLLRYELPKSRKKELRNILLYFKDVGILEIYSINWNYQFNKTNQTYQMLFNICYLILKGLLQTDANGNVRMQKFLDEQRMCRLYEKFILEYYRREFPQIKANASQIPWQLESGNSAMLPIMQSDIMLLHKGKTLIIDAKYYSHTTQVQYDVNKLHSNNLYQIFTYVKNKDVENTGNVEGMLLYARTDESVQPNEEFNIGGNTIYVKTLNLDCAFAEISRQLNEIAESTFEI